MGGKTRTISYVETDELIWLSMLSIRTVAWYRWCSWPIEHVFNSVFSHKTFEKNIFGNLPCLGWHISKFLAHFSGRASSYWQYMYHFACKCACFYRSVIHKHIVVTYSTPHRTMQHLLRIQSNELIKNNALNTRHRWALKMVLKSF